MSPEERRRREEEARRRVMALQTQRGAKGASQYYTQLRNNQRPQVQVAPPKQSFFNKVRDVFDANTEADKFRRVQANKPIWYADEQKQAGNRYVSNNLGGQIVNSIRQSPENIGRAYGEISGQSQRARAAETRSEEENLRQLQETARKITAPGTSLAERARLRTQMNKISRLQGDAFRQSSANRKEFMSNTAPGKVAASVADVGLNLVGMGVAGVAGREVGTNIAKQGVRFAARKAAPAFFENVALNTVQGATGELNEANPTIKGMLKKAAIGGLIGTGADLVLAGIPAIRANKAYKSIVEDLANTSDQQAVKATLQTISKDLPEDQLDDVASAIAKTSDKVEVDNILKQAADAETNVAKNVVSNSTDVVDKDLVKAFKEAKTPQQTRDAVRTLFPDLDEPTLVQTAKALADAKDDKTIASIIETMQIRRKAVTDGVQTATPQGEAVTPTPEQQLAEAPQATAPIASNQAPDQNIVANQPTGQVAPSSTAAIQDATNVENIPDVIALRERNNLLQQAWDNSPSPQQRNYLSKQITDNNAEIRGLIETAQNKPGLLTRIKESITPLDSTSGAISRGGVNDDVAAKAYQQTVDNGGVTISVRGGEPNKGFAYAPNKGTEVVVPKTEFTPQNVVDYISANEKELSKRGNHIGIWEDDGNIYLDVSRVGKADPATLAEAQKAQQLAVFDLETFQEVPLGKMENGVYTPLDETTNIYNQYRGQVSGANASGSVSGPPEVQPKQAPVVNVPQEVTNASTITGEFQKAMVDKDAAYINYLKRVEKETGQTGLVDQFYYDSGLQRRSNSIANSQTSNSQSLSEAFGGLTGDAKKEFDDYVSLRNEIANAKNGLVTKEKLPALQAKEAALRAGNEERFKALNAYYKEWAGRLREAGIIDEPTYNSFVKNDDYTRVQRVMDDLQGYSAGGGDSRSLGQSKSWFKRKGSLRETQPADITALNYAQQMQSEIQRNQTASNIIDVLQSQGVAKKLPSSQAANKNTIRRIVDGKTEIYQVPRDIKEVADNITPFQLGTLGKIVAAPQRALRAGATGLSAPFTAANYVKDQASVAVLSKDLVATSLNPKNAAEGLFRAAQETLGGNIDEPIWRKFIEVGGDTTGYDFLRNAKSAKKASREVRLGTKGKYANMAGSPIRTLEDLNSITERATRFQSFKGVYDKVLKQTGNEAEAMRQATLASWQNSVDFSRMGNVAQAINLVIPYFNAGIQGTRLLGRRLAQNPVATTTKALGFLALPVAGATLYNMADPERRKVYENISDYEKENNIIIVLPGAKQGPDGTYDGVIKIPIQKDQIALTQPFRMQAENFAGISDQNEIAQMAQQFFGAFSGPVNTGSIRGFLGSLTPQVVKPGVQQVANQDLFTGKEIVPDYINQATDAQGNPVAEKDKAYDFTSGTARMIGGKLGVSPLRVEKFIKDTTSKVGLYSLNASDNVLAKLGVIKPDQIGGISVKDDIARRFVKAQGEYNYQKSAGGKYFDAVKQATANLNANEKAAYNTLHPSKTNFRGEDIFDENKRLTKYARAGIYLQFPKVFAADKALNDSQAKQGNPSNPLYALPKDQLTRVLLKATLPPGAKDPELSNLYEKDWYQDYNTKRSKYYKEIKAKLAKEGKKMPKSDNPYPDTPDNLQKAMDTYSSLPKGTGARSSWIRSNGPTFELMKQQWGAIDSWENKERVKLGLSPIDNTDTSSSSGGKGKFGYGSGGGTKKEKEQRLYLSQLLGNVPTATSAQAQIKRTPTRAKFKAKLPSGKGRNYKKIKLN